MADREARVAAGCDTVYDVMSMTKQFTAAAILKLEMMGKLGVTDPIGRHIGPVPADKRGITLHQLLTHTSGLVGVLGGDYERQTRGSMLAAALESELQAAPGAEYAYSNVGYSVLAAIVEKVSGIGYEGFLAEAPVRAGGDDPDRVRAAGLGAATRSRWSTTGRAGHRAGRSTIPGPPTVPTGTCAATAVCSPPPATCSAGSARWRATRSWTDARSDKLFKPHVLEEPGGDSYYGYGWVILRDGRRQGRLARRRQRLVLRRVDPRARRGAMVFWITNQYRSKAAPGTSTDSARR